MGNPKAAEIAFLRARELGVTGEELDILLAYAHLGQGAFNQVISETSSEVDRSTAMQRDLIVARGDALLALEKLDEAEDAYDRVLAEGPHAMALRGKAAVAFNRQQPEKSRELLDRALELEPENDDVVTEIGREWCSEGGGKYV